jgi:hypothetical protein
MIESVALILVVLHLHQWHTLQYWTMLKPDELSVRSTNAGRKRPFDFKLGGEVYETLDMQGEK